MLILKAVAVSGLIMASALTGCTSGVSAPVKPAAQAGSTYKPNNGDYAPNYWASTSIGQVMTTPVGATVYTFDKDEAGKSNCYADCAQDWPPVIAKSDAQPYGRMSLASRTDGQQQWAYDGKPLYTFAKDNMHGDIKGDNVGSDWHVVK